MKSDWYRLIPARPEGRLRVGNEPKDGTILIRGHQHAARSQQRRRQPHPALSAGRLRAAPAHSRRPLGGRREIATLEALEREFGVARVTVRQAIDLLQSEGLVKSFQGRGTFVTKAPDNDRWIQLATDWERLIAPIRDNVRTASLAGDGRPQPRGGRRDAGSVLRLHPQRQTQGGRLYALRASTSPSHIHARAERSSPAPGAGRTLRDGRPRHPARPPDSRHRRRRHGDRAHLGIALNAPTAEARCVVTDAKAW